VDTVTPARRSEIMAAIRSKDTALSSRCAATFMLLASGTGYAHANSRADRTLSSLPAEFACSSTAVSGTVAPIASTADER
jgi:hypothetical protein